MTRRSLVWFRGKELRVSDHGPLSLAAQSGEVIPVFVLDPYFFEAARAQQLAHRMQFLLESITSLEANLALRGSRLLVVAGKSVDVIPRLAAKWRVDRVVAQRWSEPFARERDRRVAGALRVPFDLLGGETLLPPATLRSGGGTPYAVFSSFAHAFSAHEKEIGTPLPLPRRLPPIPVDVACSDAVAIPELAALGIQPNPRLISGGEAAARARLRDFMRGPLEDYAEGRDAMSLEGTSRLSADLHFGTLSPRSVWAAIRNMPAAGKVALSKGIFCKQLVWREFAHATLWDRPEVLVTPFRSDFQGFPWRTDETQWKAWVDGTTGYPVVDAAARQLLAQGYVHNRARMVAASFLAKHLMIDFRRGEAHYLAYLVDGDWANNDLGWQWSAGCGCDAQPYFRVFNPTLQGKRFDPEGNYVRRWVPELSLMPSRFIHGPWEAPAEVLRAAGVTLGSTYPHPCVDHASARERFLRTAKEHLAPRAPPLPSA